MNFKKINESFEKLYQPIDESLNYTEDCIKRLEEALNEAEISDEDKHDSDLIRSMLDKMQGRSNAKFSPEEIAVMDKYGIKRDNWSKNLTVDGRPLKKDIDTSRSNYYHSTHFSNGTPSKINYADRARKLPKRKDSQIFTDPWTADNDQINAHGYSKANFADLQDAERYAQDIPTRDKIGKMKGLLRDRKYAQSDIDNADATRDAALDKAKAVYDKAVASAEQDYKRNTVGAASRRDHYQDAIDKLLKRKPIEESIEPRYEKMGMGQARLDILDRCEQLGVWEEVFRDFLDHMTDEQVYKIAKAGDWLYTDED